jgi:hypothetical protein
MPTESRKPLIVISYAHADEPEHPAEGELKWLSYVMGYLRPAIKHGAVDLWVDRLMSGGADWEREIEQKLRLRHLHPARLAALYVIAFHRQGDRNHPRAAGKRRDSPLLSGCADPDAESLARPPTGQQLAPARRQAVLRFFTRRAISADVRAS